MTNGAAGQQRAKLAALGLADRFEFVLAIEDLGVSKPHLEPEALLSLHELSNRVRAEAF